MPQETEKCPYCGALMELGYVAGARGVYWRKDIPILSLNLGEALGPHASMWQWKVPHVKANKCTNCKIVLIRYDAQTCAH
jgi:hypothetical protein